MSGHNFTRTELTELDRYEHGATILDIAHALHRHSSVIIDWLTMLGMYHPKYRTHQKIEDFTALEVEALNTYRQGATIASIAKLLGVSAHSIRNWLGIVGIEIRRNASIQTPIALCARCEVDMQDQDIPYGDGFICGYCIQEIEYIAKLKMDEQRVPGYVVTLPEMVLVEERVNA